MHFYLHPFRYRHPARDRTPPVCGVCRENCQTASRICTRFYPDQSLLDPERMDLVREGIRISPLCLPGAGRGAMVGTFMRYVLVRRIHEQETFRFACSNVGHDRLYCPFCAYFFFQTIWI